MTTVQHSLSFFQRTKQESCPQTPPSIDPRWKPNNHEEKLLEFLDSLILDLARNHPRVTNADVAAWLVNVAAGSPNIEKLEELRAWRKKAALAKEFLEKFPDCTPAQQFLERFKEKFGYELGL
jgi:hypothetical protein